MYIQIQILVNKLITLVMQNRPKNWHTDIYLIYSTKDTAWCTRYNIR